MDTPVRDLWNERQPTQPASHRLSEVEQSIVAAIRATACSENTRRAYRAQGSGSTSGARAVTPRW